MWLLETSCAKLKYFPSPESVPGGYAILSHVWDEVEQTFQETQELSTQCAATGENPRGLSSEKIKNFCIIAEKHGHRWGWADSSCIDKSSSAELSEAINSMYRYYGKAEVCYAYLRDVGHDNAEDAFKSSRWHGRGWTLQELLAPRVLIFLTHDWRVYSTKFDLAPQLQEITGIPVEVLRFAKEVNEMSVAQRMSWAAKRKTRRLEDEAYCLMGIFGINMSTIYGEGPKAFRRLQEEIMKGSVDTSLFAWDRRGTFCTDPSPGLLQECFLHCSGELFADSPRCFEDCRDVLFQGHILRRKDRNERASSKVPSFTSTPLGVLAEIPILDTTSREFVDAVDAVMFNCTRPSRYSGKAAVLHLRFHPCGLTTHLAQPLYHPASASFEVLPDSSGDETSSCESKTTSSHLVWREIYLMDNFHRPQPIGSLDLFLRSHLNASLASPFHIDTRFLNVTDNPLSIKLQGWNPSVPWNGCPPLVISIIRHPDFDLHLGRCTATGDRGSLWASILSRNPPQGPNEDKNPDPTHSCLVDHIEDWEERSKVMVMPEHRIVDRLRGRRSVKLWFSPSPFCDTVLVPHTSLLFARKK